MTDHPTLVTGFEPFDGLDRNPSAEVVGRLEGRTIGGAPVIGRILPVSLQGYRPVLATAIEEVRPGLVIALGLAQGAATVRVERVGVNLADFEIADNDGTLAEQRILEGDGPPARFSTFPVAVIESTLLKAGIPARVSNSAGAYLCNACLYSLLGMAGAGRPEFAAGFIHLPYLTEQVAALTVADRRKGEEMPSMSLEVMVRAVEMAIEASRDHRSAAAMI